MVALSRDVFDRSLRGAPEGFVRLKQPSLLSYFPKAVKKFNWLGIAAITIVVITFTLTHQILFPVAVKGVEAFGHPGACPTWSPSNLTFLGTAANPTSKVWFTGFDGILGQIFYPGVDTPATVDWEFLVGDANHTWVDEEKRDTTHQVTLNSRHSLAGDS
jgi:glucoamylase